MKKFLFWSVAVMMFLSAPVIGSAQINESSGQGQLYEIYQKFLAAAESRNLDEIGKYVLEYNMEELQDETEEGLKEFFRMMELMMPKTLLDVEEEFSGRRGVLTAIAPELMMGSQRAAIFFEIEHGVWKIDKIEMLGDEKNR